MYDKHQEKLIITWELPTDIPGYDRWKTDSGPEIPCKAADLLNRYAELIEEASEIKETLLDEYGIIAELAR